MATATLEELWEKGDISLVKYGSGAFASELDAVLRNRGVRSIIYAGVLMIACVLLSTAAGFDLGDRQCMVAD